MKTLKRFGYWSPAPIPEHRRRYRIIAAQKSEDIHYEMKKREITCAALEHMYLSPCLREPKKMTVRQMRLKMLLHEALDVAHAICAREDADECLWAWEIVDEIDDAATRAGVWYR
jgi:hypothetical protein